MLSIFKSQSYIHFFSCSPRTAHHHGLLIPSSGSLGIFSIRSLTNKYSTQQKSLTCQGRYRQCYRSHARERCMLHQSEWVLFLGHPCPVPSLYHPKQEHQNKLFLLHHSSCKFSIQYYSYIKSTVSYQGTAQYCLLGQDISKT